MYYLFEDNATGEIFFVEAEESNKALDIANEYFEEAVLIDIMTEEESEWYPYDVY